MQLSYLATTPTFQLLIVALVALLLIIKNPIREWNNFYILFLVIISLFTAKFILQGFPSSAIEESFLIQGKIFSSGKLWLEEFPLAKYLLNRRMIVQEGKIISQYTPGWPLILSVLYTLKVPDWALNPILGGLCLILVTKILDLLKIKSSLVVGCLAMSSFFILNSASYFCHIACSLAVLCGLYSFLRSTENYRWAIAMGFSFAVAAAIRPYTALFLATPIGIFLIFKQQKVLLFSIVGGLPVIIPLLAYNWAVTGNPLVDPFSWRYFESNPIQLIKVNQSNVPKFNYKLFSLAGWTNPVIVILGLWKILQRTISFKLTIFDWMVISLSVGYFLFPDSAGNQYGPRYLLEAFPIFCIGLAIPSPRSNIKFERHMLSAAMITMILVLPFFLQVAKRPIDKRIAFRQNLQTKSLENSVVIAKGAPFDVIHIGDLAQNSLTFDDSTLFAWDAGGNLCEFKNKFPGRKIYLLETEKTIAKYSIKEICQ